MGPLPEIRVLQVVRALDVGGLEQVVIDLVNGLGAHSGVKPYLACLSHPGARVTNAVPRGIWVGGDTVNRRFVDLGVLRSLVRHIRSHQIDIIHSHNPVPHRYGVLASILTGVPLVHTKHGRNYPDSRKAVWLNRLYARFTRRIVAVSADAAKVALEVERIPRRKLATIGNGVDTERFSPPESEAERHAVRSELGLAPDQFVVGTVGRLAPEKNYGLLIEAFAGLIRNMENAALVLVGDGPERGRLEILAAEHGVAAHVVFTGQRSDVPRMLQAFDVFTLSSITEGLSISLLEAMACGCPAVVTDVGGNSQLVTNGVTGFVVTPGNSAEFAAKLAQLSHDPERIFTMGAAARVVVCREYSVERMCARYADLYREVLRVEDAHKQPGFETR